MMEKSIKKNTFYNMLKTFFAIAFPLITFPYVSRVLGPEKVGKYNFAQTYVSYFGLLASLGITTYAIRECASVRDQKEKVEKVASQIFSINVCTTVGAYLLLFLTMIFSRKLDSYCILIVIFSNNILFATMGTDWINSAFEDFKFITLRTFFFQIVSLLLTFLCVHSPQDVTKYALIIVVSSVGANICNIFYRRRFCKIKFQFDMGWKKHFPSIMLLFVMLLAQQIFCNADITMLGMMRNDREVGLYSITVKVYNILDQVFSSILWVLLPRLSMYYEQKDYDSVNVMLRKCFQMMWGIGLPCIVGVFFEAYPVIMLVGGKEYVDAIPILQIFMITEIVALLGGSFLGNIICLSSKREKQFTESCLLATVVNVVLNYIFIPKMGMYASAITTLISLTVILVYLLMHVKEKINIGGFKESVFPPILGSLLIILWCSVIDIIWDGNTFVSFGISVCGSVAIYAIVLYKMKYGLFIENIELMKEKCMTFIK